VTCDEHVERVSSVERSPRSERAGLAKSANRKGWISVLLTCFPSNVRERTAPVHTTGFAPYGRVRAVQEETSRDVTRAPRFVADDLEVLASGTGTSDSWLKHAS
jgi:hypothetical protein